MVERPLRILQVSTADRQGGAEKVAWDLFTSYRARGHDSKLAVGVKRSDDPDVLIVPNEESRGRWYRFFRNVSLQLQERKSNKQLAHLAGVLAEPVRRLNYYRGVEDLEFPGTSRLLKLAGGRPDIIHAHNLHGAYFDLRMLPRLSQQVPVLLTLHDAWLLSGHCAHSLGCERWKTGCGHCPDLTIYPAVERDATTFNWRRKRDIFSRSRLYVAVPSEWLRRKVEGSILAPAIVEARTIPNGVDLDLFHPAPQAEARSSLGIPADSRVLLAGGVNVRVSVWRDFQMLRESVTRASQQLDEQDVMLILLGEEAPPGPLGSAKIRSVAFQQDAGEMARYLQAADIYLHASRADTFPLSVLEALACGTPVIATAVGGIPEQVEDSVNGFLVEPGDASRMADKILSLLQDGHLKQNIQLQAAARARQQFGLQQQVETYLDWYHELAAK